MASDYVPKPSTIGYVGLGVVGAFGVASLARYVSRRRRNGDNGVRTPQHSGGGADDRTNGFEAIEDMTDKHYGSFTGKHVISVKGFERFQVEYIFRVASRMKDVRRQRGYIDLCKGQLLASIFYEPSTRTSCSFQAAMYRLGGQVISINDVKSSSVKKGESLEDTMKTLESYCDVIVIRHPEVGSAARASRAVSIPVLNAGDGAGEHPTQALLDLFTIYSEFQSIDGLTVTMVGDLKHGRTVHSLAKALTLFDDVTLQFVSPESLAMPVSVLDDLKENNCEFAEYTDVVDVISNTDVLYVTRIQKERFDDPGQYEDVRNSYCITPSVMNKAKKKMVVMHPLPRVNEINVEVDDDPRAAYFRQMENGLFVRMALLAMCLGKA